GEYPSTCCMYRVPMKMYAKKPPPRSTPTAFAPASVFTRKIRSGISGASTRVSMTAKAASRAAETASSATVLALPQPTRGGGGDRVDQQRQGAGHRNRAERVIAPPLGGEP